MLKGQFDAVKRLEGDNPAGIIERFKTMFGLNYHGAASVYNMMKNADEDKNGNLLYDGKSITDIIEGYKIDPKMASDSVLLQDTLNKINNTLVSIGGLEVGKEIEILNKTQRDVEAIKNKIIAEMKAERATEVAREITSSEHMRRGESIIADKRIDNIINYRNNRLAKVDYGETEAEKFRTLIGSISDPSNIKKELFDAIQEYSAKWTGVIRSGMTAQERDELNPFYQKMGELVNALYANTKATDINSSADKDIHIKVINHR